MPDYLPAVYPWYLQVETFALLGLVIGKTAWDNKYIKVVTVLIPMVWVLNFFYLVGDHKFNLFGSFQTTSKMKCYNLTWNSKPVKEQFSLFTAEDIGAIGLALTTLFLLMFSFYCMRKHMFGIIWWKKAEKETKEQEKWTGILVKKFTKNYDFPSFIKLGVLWAWFVIAQGFFTIIPFQVAHQWVPLSGRGLDQQGNSWNLAWFGGFLFLGSIISLGVWILWAWKIDSEREIMLTQKFPLTKGNGWEWMKGYPWYLLFELIFFGEMFFFGFLQAFRNIKGVWMARVYYTFGFAVIFSVIHFALALGFYWINYNKAVDSGEYMPTEEEYSKMKEEEEKVEVEV